jgi:hypothetical protein
MVTESKAIQFENDLHDWYIDGVMLLDGSMSLYVHFYEEQKIIKFNGVTRCLINELLIKNIIYEAKILSAADHHDLFQVQIQRLDETYPRKWAEPTGIHILQITASVGADFVVEFDNLEIKQLSRA